MKKLLFFFVATLMAVSAAVAQNPMMQAPNPAEWSASVALNEDGKGGTVTITADIAKGWHVYGLDIPEGGPNATSINFDGTSKCIHFDSDLKIETAPVKMMDDVFEIELSWWEDKAVFTRTFTIAEQGCCPAAQGCCTRSCPKAAETSADGDCKIVVNVNFMACNDQSCMPPRTDTVTVNVK